MYAIGPEFFTTLFLPTSGNAGRAVGDHKGWVMIGYDGIGQSCSFESPDDFE
jgi:hypothetical protein